MQSEFGFKQRLTKIDQASSLSDALSTAEDYCENCKTSSPMVCVERCDVWRLKHEILEIRRVTGENYHTRQLLNVIKNKRRLRILDALCERSCNVKELQRYLRDSGFYHSRRTIFEAYLKPLMRVGLVREDDFKFKATFYGRKVHGLLMEHSSLGLLPVHSCCYEEIVLQELKTPQDF